MLDAEMPKMQVIEEQPLITIEHYDYDNHGYLHIYPSMLRNASVGTEFVPDVNSNCGRGVYSEKLKVVYREGNGIAAVLSKRRTTDDSDPVEIDMADELIWFRLRG